jgi:hypothetical protein
VKRLVRKHSIRAGELRKMLRALGVDVPDGGNVVTFVEALTAEQAAEFVRFVELGPVPTGDSDVPAGDVPAHEPAEPGADVPWGDESERTTPMDVGPS